MWLDKQLSKMKKFTLVFAILFVAQLTGQTLLQYNFSVGDKFTINQQATQHITQDISGMIQEINNDLSGTMSFEVVKADKETFTLIMEFKSLKMLMSSPTLGELSNVDSASDDDSDITSMMFKGILNVPITIVMGRDGKIKSVTGGDLLIESMFKAVDITEPEIIEASKSQLEKQFGSEALSNSFEQMTYLFSTDKVKVNSKWKNSYQGDMSAETTWTLSEINKNNFKLSGVAATTMNSIDETISMTLNGTQSTTVTGNSKTGLFTELIVIGENTGNTVYTTQEITIPTTIKSTITYKIIQ